MCADDAAMVLEDARAELPQLHRIFGAMEVASQLRLNIPKCVFVPFFSQSEDDATRMLAEVVPEYATMTCALRGTYLGFTVCPDKNRRAWDKALRKATERVRLWHWGELGLFYVSQVWNTFIASLVGFVAQLERPPPYLDEVSTMLLRKAAYGPGNWCHAADAHNLKRAFGFAGEFRHLGHVARAAMFRASA